MGAAVITLEHRFYGKSIPFGTYSNEALEYLIVEQVPMAFSRLKRNKERLSEMQNAESEKS